MKFKGDASCHHNHIYKTKLGSVRPIFQTLNTIPEHILYSLKVPILGQFQTFSAICPAQLWGSHPARFGDRVRVSYLLLSFIVLSGIGCAHFTIYSVIQMAPTDSGK